MNTQEIYNWLHKRKDFLKISRIEKGCGMPPRTIQYFLEGGRALPDKWLPVLSKWIIQFTGRGKKDVFPRHP